MTPETLAILILGILAVAGWTVAFMYAQGRKRTLDEVLPRLIHEDGGVSLPLIITENQALVLGPEGVNRVREAIRQLHKERDAVIQEILDRFNELDSKESA